MKYMIMTFGDQAGLAAKSQDWIREMIAFMQAIDLDLRESGELVYEEGLADPSQAITVRMNADGPTPTDGPFVASRMSLAGFWIVDVADESRAIEIASRIVAFIQEPVEVRQCMEAPPDV
jgi:hypothetical protein